ncbi:hypothetical protein EJB05_16613, partial [Eragrostis curvula]
MIPGSALYHVVEAMAPLYTAAVLGYASVRWLKAFSDEQCAGINHFVALYAAPVLTFHMVATNDPYRMNGRLIAADTLQKAVIILFLKAGAALWSRFRHRRGGDGKASARSSTSLKWVVTNFSSATLTNTLIMGVPLLNGMYGAVSGGLIAQIVMMQVCVWFNVVIFLYQYMSPQDGIVKIGPGSSPATVAENIEVMEAAAATASSATQDSTTREMTTKSKDGGVTTAAEEAVDVPGPEPAHAPSVMLVLRMAGKKLYKIPNTYATFLGLLWSLIAFRLGISLPKIVDDSLSIISTTAVGLSMFASGTFIARQPRFVPCGYAIASLSMVLKFLVGPVVMLFTSLAMGLRGTLLHIAVVQAALPLAVISFVYAEEYKVHADIMSTGVILGIFISLPVTIIYYILLGT